VLLVGQSLGLKVARELKHQQAPRGTQWVNVHDRFDSDVHHPSLAKQPRQLAANITVNAALLRHQSGGLDPVQIG
jgi:hypothetical protein